MAVCLPGLEGGVAGCLHPSPLQQKQMHNSWCHPEVFSETSREHVGTGAGPGNLPAVSVLCQRTVNQSPKKCEENRFFMPVRWEGAKCMLSFDGRIGVHLFRPAVNITCVRGTRRTRCILTAGRVCVTVRTDSASNVGTRRGGACRATAGHRCMRSVIKEGNI